MGCGGGSKKTESTQTQQLDPQIRTAFFGSPTPDPSGQITGGIFGEAMDLYKSGPKQFFPGQTYAGLNPIQRGALGSTINYLSSPESMGGYNAAQTVGKRLIDNPVQLPEIPTAPPDYLSSMMGREAPQIEATAGPTAGSVHLPDGQNPWLQQMLGDIRANTIGDFNRSVAPMARGSAQMAGGFGGSRQGVVEANAMNDLGRNLGTAQTSLLGSVYESDANRRLSAEQTNASLATQASLAGAQLAAERARGNAALTMQGRGLDLDLGRTMADYGLNATGLRQQGLLQGAQLSGNQALAGAGLLQDASRVPVENLAGIMAAGSDYQTDAQRRMDAARERWDFNQNAPYEALAMLQGVFQPNATMGQTIYGREVTKNSPGLFDWMNMFSGNAARAFPGAG